MITSRSIDSNSREVDGGRSSEKSGSCGWSESLHASLAHLKVPATTLIQQQAFRHHSGLQGAVGEFGGSRRSITYLIPKKIYIGTMSEQEEQRVNGTSEEEPLLGRAGDASQQDGKPLYHNFVIGKLPHAALFRIIVANYGQRHWCSCAGWHLDCKQF